MDVDPFFFLQNIVSLQAARKHSLLKSCILLNRTPHWRCSSEEDHLNHLSIINRAPIQWINSGCCIEGRQTSSRQNRYQNRIWQMSWKNKRYQSCTMTQLICRQSEALKAPRCWDLLGSAITIIIIIINENEGCSCCCFQSKYTAITAIYWLTIWQK